VGLRTGLDAVEYRKISYPRRESKTYRPAPHHYTGSAILAPYLLLLLLLIFLLLPLGA
jgi:hypothetical protein